MMHVVEKKKFKDFRFAINHFNDNDINIYNYVRAKDIDKIFCANYSFDVKQESKFKKSSLSSLLCMYKNNITITKSTDYLQSANRFEIECYKLLCNAIVVNNYSFVIDNFVVKADYVEILSENEIYFVECKNAQSLKKIIIQNFHNILLMLLLIERINQSYDICFKYKIIYKDSFENIKTIIFYNLLSFLKYAAKIMNSELEKIIKHIKQNCEFEKAADIFINFLLRIFKNISHENIYLKNKSMLLEEINFYLQKIYEVCIKYLNDDYDEQFCYEYVEVDCLDDMKKINKTCYTKLNNEYYVKYKNDNVVHKAFVGKLVENVVFL